jgi:phosphate transport system substrate-binding protein
MRRYHIILLFFLILLGAACGNYGEKEKDTPTSGNIGIVADEEYQSLTRAEIQVYTSLYVHARINTVYKPEDSAFNSFLKDSVRLLVSSRRLTQAEETYLNNNHQRPEQVKIGTDAVVFIVNNTNPDTLLSVENLKAFFAGKDSLWQQINDKNKGQINVVFDNGNSGSIRYVQQSLMQGQKIPANCFAVHGNNQVVEYVSKTPNAMGIIGLDCVGNEYDTTVMNTLKKVKMVALSAKEGTGYFGPYMGALASGQYPLCRDVYIISKEPYTGLGSGLLSFVMSNKGQRIIYAEGLLPIKMPSNNIHY